MARIHIIHVRRKVTDPKTWCGRPATLDTVDKSMWDEKWRYCKNCTTEQIRLQRADQTIVGNPYAR